MVVAGLTCRLMQSGNEVTLEKSDLGKNKFAPEIISSWHGTFKFGVTADVYFKEVF